jgi:hypothetical protein
MIFGTLNVRNLYNAGSLTAAARELTRYKLVLVGVQKVRWDKEGTVRAEIICWRRFFMRPIVSVY